VRFKINYIEYADCGGKVQIKLTLVATNLLVKSGNSVTAQVEYRHKKIAGFIASKGKCRKCDKQKRKILLISLIFQNSLMAQFRKYVDGSDGAVAETAAFAARAQTSSINVSLSNIFAKYGRGGWPPV
jgi:hypothetical protein